MLEEMLNARRMELRVQARDIHHRMEWHELSRIDKLERALKAARGRLSMLPAGSGLGDVTSMTPGSDHI